MTMIFEDQQPATRPLLPLPQLVPPLAVALTMDETTRGTLRRNEGAVALAEAFEIDSQDMADEAVRQLQVWKTSAGKLDLLYKGFVEPAKAIVERAKELFNPARASIAEGDRILRAKLLAWNEEQHRLVAERRAAAEEAERAARQRAESEAAQARAAAEAAAAAARRRAETAEAERRQALAAGDAITASAAAARAAEATEHAHAAVENGEHRAVTATLEAAASVTVIAPPAATKGFGVRDNWKVELAQGVTAAQAIQAIAAAIVAGRTDLCAYLSLDLKAADKGAKALKDHFQVPGLKAVNKPSSVVRGA